MDIYQIVEHPESLLQLRLTRSHANRCRICVPLAEPQVPFALTNFVTFTPPDYIQTIQWTFDYSNIFGAHMDINYR